MRRIVGLMTALIMLLLPAAALAETAPIQLVINGEPAVTDVAPVIENDRTLVPIRALSEPLGFAVEWNATERSVTLTKDDQIILLYVDRSEAFVNGETKSIDVPPVIRSDRTLIPVRFVSENMGLDVQWDGVNRIVSVGPKPAEQPVTPPGPTEPAAPPDPVTPSAASVWQGMNDTRSDDLHIRGTVKTTDADGMVTEVTTEIYVKGADVLSLTRVVDPATGEGVDLQKANYKGEFWQSMAGSEWTSQGPAQDQLATDVGGLPSSNLTLDKAKVELAQGDLNGVPMTKLTVEWENAVLAEATGADLSQIGEGTTKYVYWVNKDGQLVQTDQYGDGILFGQRSITEGTYTFEPLEGEIPFPAEILK